MTTDYPTGAPFPPTRHSAILALRSDDAPERKRARDTLCRVYWRPVYAHLRLRWRKEPESARDLTQSFFLKVLERDFFTDFDPSKARFRTYLRLCVDRFVQNADLQATAIKRGGGVQVLPLDLETIEQEVSAIAGADRPDDVFDREWLRSLMTVAVTRFRERCAEQGKQVPMALFEAYVLNDDDPRPTYAQLAAAHNLTTDTVTNYLAWGRREFRDIVLTHIRELTVSEQEYRDEVKAVLGIDLP